jgi:FkbM family methyltransferase
MTTVSGKIKLLLFRLFRKPYKKRLFGNTEILAELKLTELFLRQHPDFLFIDAGANRGEFIYTAEHVLSPSKIFAFEPLPWFAQKLQVLFPGIHVHACALSDHAHNSTLYLPVNNGTPDDSLSSVSKPDGSFISYQINCVTLDEIIAGNGPYFMKIDVEGHEFAVLHGGKKTLEKTKLLLVEIEERHHSGKPLAEMITEIEDQEFICYYLHPQKKQLVQFREIPQVFQKPADLNTVRYVNNFWFFAKQLNYSSVVEQLNRALL